jgi:hypothetical protein
MKTVLLALAATLCLATVPAVAQAPNPPRDVGSMNYPAPLPSGSVTTTAPVWPHAPSDTGNMAYPAPLPQGSVTTTTAGANRPTDVGSMNYPASLPSGAATTTAK